MVEPDPRAPGPTETGATETSFRPGRQVGMTSGLLLSRALWAECTILWLIAPWIPIALSNLPPAVCTYQIAGQPALAQPRPGVPLVMTKEAYLNARVAEGFGIDLAKPIDCRARKWLLSAV